MLLCANNLLIYSLYPTVNVVFRNSNINVVYEFKYHYDHLLRILLLRDGGQQRPGAGLLRLTPQHRSEHVHTVCPGSGDPPEKNI